MEPDSQEGRVSSKGGTRSGQWVGGSAWFSPGPTAAEHGQIPGTSPPQLAKAAAKGEWVLRTRDEQRALGQEGPDLGELVHDDVQAMPLHVQRLRLVGRLQDLQRQVP